jgi:hypothetical protein
MPAVPSGALLLALLAALDTRSALAQLSAPRAEERLAAERWLATHLDPVDFPLLAEAAGKAELEVQRRLERALGGDDRHFALAALLAREYEPGPRELGEHALEQMAARWWGAERALDAASWRSVLDALSGRSPQAWSLRPAAASLDLVLDRLARLAAVEVVLDEGSDPPALVLDPLLYAEPWEPPLEAAQRAREVAGDLAELLAAAAGAHGASFVGFGLEGPHPWILVLEPADAGRLGGAQLCVRWAREALEYPDAPRGRGAARALAATGWPAALAWLEERWLEARDRNALSALLLAAGRGRVAPALAIEGAVDRLLEAADGALRSNARERTSSAGEILRALAAMGPLGADGSDLSARVVQGWESATPQERRLRLLVLQGMGHAPEAFRAELKRTLGEPAAGLDPSLRVELVRTLSATLASAPLGGDRPATPLALAQPAQVLEAAYRAGRAGRAGELVRDLARLGVRPPEEAGAALEGDLRGFVLEWWLEVGEPSSAARLLEPFVLDERSTPSRELARRLAERAARGELAQLQRLFDAVAERLGEGERRSLERFRALSGALPPELHEALLRELVEDGPREDLAVVAALTAGPAGEAAREELLRAVSRADGRGGLDAELAAAFERALVELWRSGQDGTAARVRTRLIALLRTAQPQPWWDGLNQGTWPRLGDARPRSLEARERDLDPAAAGR